MLDFQNKLLFQLYVTDQCPHDCWYCPQWKKKRPSPTPPEIDIDFVLWFLGQLPEGRNICVSITGGEPQLCSNLTDLLEELEAHPRVGKYSVATSLNPVFPSHFTRLIVNHHILSFDQVPLNPYVENGHIYPVLVATWNTMGRLKSHPEYLDHIFLSPLLARCTCNSKYVNKYYSLISNHTHRGFLHQRFRKVTPSFNCKCSKFPPHPYLFLPTRELGMCGYNQTNQPRYDCTVDNIRRWLTGDLFSNVICPWCLREDWVYPYSYFLELSNGRPFNRTAWHSNLSRKVHN